MHDPALAPADFEFIEDILLKYGDDNSVLNLAEFDGNIHRRRAGHQGGEVAIWFPAIWGDQIPAWESKAELEQFIDLCTRHLTGIAQQLASDAQGFRARFEQTEHQGLPLTLAEEWCFGYIRGAAISQWPALPAEQAAQLETISWCAEQDNFQLPADLDVAAHQQQVARIEPAARALHAYWLSLRG